MTTFHVVRRSTAFSALFSLIAALLVLTPTGSLGATEPGSESAETARLVRAVAASELGLVSIDALAADQSGNRLIATGTAADGSSLDAAFDFAGHVQVSDAPRSRAGRPGPAAATREGQEVTITDESTGDRSIVDLADLDLSADGPVVLAPSSDRTDADTEMSLYLADGERVVEAAFGAGVQFDRVLQTSAATQVRTYDLSQLNPPSPDPAGVTWMADRNQLLISDSEVEETNIYAGRNLIRLDPTTGAAPGGSTTTTAFSNEPTGVSYNPSNGHVFISDDSREEVFEVDPGPDDIHGTPDDLVTQFDVLGFGSVDPEDIVLAQGDLYIVDGINREVYVVGPGPNGWFDGQPIEGGDDVFTHFDVSRFGLVDPEAITYRSSTDTLLIADHRIEAIFETTRQGAFVGTIDLVGVGIERASGLTLAPPSSGTGGEHLYITDLGVDNDQDPNENDGRLVELRIDPGADPILLCNGRRATVYGSANSELVIGTAGRDVIVARGGNDTIEGRGGDDVICGGGGNDTIIGGRGADRLYGQAGSDTIDGSIGKDFVDGGSGNDQLHGGLGRDMVWGSGGTDECWGERMRCEVKHRTLHSGVVLHFCQGVRATVVGTNGADTLLGTAGDDVIVGMNGNDVIDAGRGNDLVCAGDGQDTVLGGRGGDSVYGESGGDFINGGRGKDFVHGGGGADELQGGLGRDMVWGAGGIDECWGEQMRCEIEHRTFHNGRSG